MFPWLFVRWSQIIINICMMFLYTPPYIQINTFIVSSLLSILCSTFILCLIKVIVLHVPMNNHPYHLISYQF